MNDLSGKVFGKLTVTGRAENTSAGAAQWSCLCECGNFALVRGTNLVNGHTASCGCARVTSRSKTPRARTPRIRIDLYRGQFAHLEFGFAVIWLPYPEGLGEGDVIRQHITIPAMPRPKATGPISVTLARALFELQRIGLMKPHGSYPVSRWMASEGVEAHTVLVSGGDADIREAWRKVHQHDQPHAEEA